MSVVSRLARQKSWQIADDLVSLLDDLEIESEQLGPRLRALARARGIGSDEEAARAIGVSYRQYQRWLSGESEPRGRSLKLISEGLGVPLAEVVGKADPSQLDRIEEKLERLLQRLDPEQVSPEEEADAVIEEAERDQAAGGRGAGGSPGRSAAGARATQKRARARRRGS